MSKIEEMEGSDFEDNNLDSSPSEVYLAFIDTPVKEVDEVTIEDSFIGGEPIWLHPDSIPPEEYLHCGACKSKDRMKLLVQAFSPLDPEQVNSVQSKHNLNNLSNVNSNDDRVLYVFVCTKCPRKGNSIRCIRGVKKNKTSNLDVVNEKMEDLSMSKDFKINPFDLTKETDSANPFSNNPFQNNNSPFSKSKEPENKVSESDNKQSIKATRKQHDLLNDKKYDSKIAFKNYLLYVEKESFKNKPDHLKLPKNLKIDDSALELDANGIEEDLGKNPIKLDPRTEKLSKFLDDDVFQKFQEVVGYNPHQVLRYEFGGNPLLYAASKIDFNAIVANPSYNPSSKRIFEMQLMPNMIMDLEENVNIEDGMEWGTILVYTDIENYIPQFDKNDVGYVEEVVKVQWELRE
ncbi:hypothetical protein TPHA_0A02300 [Tetrapisispora phaffii CBS 4417]|uniref:Programmed cell death protein 2 C-terminal domain-containing protein n=1 Tax=Tetrapisispora phaffii (strain ATCC 24235 / CBS 4417 / NBRC 1672 / NRRL Y-8282 / UCD 70-5) TaxID=1071381 RepID=G8BN34_TETPH|nr:hypothetical protein TPHA_0A02300 [Tetrapisispora phaffii CBS 4417]CCE61312.1 hypothetical protein TPHA_0A02300 [Tetrapisispora phaffii CBS 4417]